MPDNPEFSALFSELRALNQNLRNLNQGSALDPVWMTKNVGVTQESDLMDADWQVMPFEGRIEASGQTQVNRLVPSESHFLLVFITGLAWEHEPEGGGFIGQTNLRLKIHDGSSERNIIEGGRWVRWPNLIGSSPNVGGGWGTFLSTANAPYTIPGARRFIGTSTIVIELSDLSGIATDFEIALHGYKVKAQKS